MTDKNVHAMAHGILVKTGKYTKFHKYEDHYQVKKDNVRKEAVNVTVEKLHLNLVQREMYRRLMYGLNNYTPEQRTAMSAEQITKIVKDYDRAKKVLHIMKAKKHYEAETKLLNVLFPKQKVGKKDHDWFLFVPKSQTLNKLGITTTQIVDEFIARHLLPKNFYELKADTILI
jgi:hypothetical protein